MNKQCNSRKVVIVGAGNVGAAFAYALLQSGTAENIVLIDARREQAEGQALDLAHGLPFVPSTVVRAGSPDDYADAAVVVITAGAKQKSGESRLNLLRLNAHILAQIAGEIAARESQAVVVVATNPVDVLTYVALKRTGWLRNRIIGSGTVLDSARFRHLLSAHCGVDVKNVHAYILGEHGDSEVPVWSMTHLAGMAMDDYCPACHKCGDWGQERTRIVTEVRNSALSYHRCQRFHLLRDWTGVSAYRWSRPPQRTQCTDCLDVAGRRIRPEGRVSQRPLHRFSIRSRKNHSGETNGRRTAGSSCVSIGA